MRHKWIVIEDAFVARGKGVSLEPKFAPEAPPKGVFEVTVRLPEGTERSFKASLDFAHSRGALPPFAMLRIFDASVEDLPKGSEVFYEDEHAR